jgi:hypothetical protein
MNSEENVRKVFQTKKERKEVGKVGHNVRWKSDARITYIALREEANKETIPVLRTFIGSRQSEIEY